MRLQSGSSGACRLHSCLSPFMILIARTRWRCFGTRGNTRPLAISPESEFSVLFFQMNRDKQTVNTMLATRTAPYIQQHVLTYFLSESIRTWIMCMESQAMAANSTPISFSNFENVQNCTPGSRLLSVACSDAKKYWNQSPRHAGEYYFSITSMRLLLAALTETFCGSYSTISIWPFFGLNRHTPESSVFGVSRYLP